MTELEFVKLLGDLPEDCIQQAQAYRNGSHRAARRVSGGKRAAGLFSAAVLAFAMLGGTFWALNQMAQQGTAQQNAAGSWQDAIVQGEADFRSETYNDTLTLEGYTRCLQKYQADSRWAPRAYAELDMDGDGKNELAVRFESGETDTLTLILWQEPEGIIGTEYTKQQMSFLKEDGTFYYSSQNHWGWGRLVRREGSWVPVIRMPQGGDYAHLPDAPWKPMPGTEALPEQTRSSCQSLGLSGKSGVSGEIIGALTVKDDYSLYVPVTGWRYARTSPYSTVQDADSWYCEEVPEARLTIFKTDLDRTAWEKTGYVLQSSSAFTSGMRRDAAGKSDILQVYIRLGETANYVMELEYPDSFWDRDILHSMLDSVRFTHSVSANREPEWAADLDSGALVPMILSVEADYSLYVPATWYFLQNEAPVAERMGENTALSWYGPLGECLSVIDLGSGSAQSAQAWAAETIDPAPADTRQQVSFLQGNNDHIYAVIARCPEESADGSWPILEYMAKSLMFAPGSDA